MKNYIGTKTIMAEPMNRGNYNKYKGWEIPKDESSEEKGYLVKYADSYESWSPKEVFEAAYHEIGAEMSFSHIFTLLKQEQGVVATRKAWNGVQIISIGKVEGRDVLVLHTLGEQEQMFLNFNISNSDLLAEDWMLLSLNN